MNPVIRAVPAKFHVAFSFAGEQRDLVRHVAEAVEDRLAKGSVFFDEWFEHYLAGHDADTKLQDIYGQRSTLVVVCVSERYGKKPWTLTENEAIRALLMKTRNSHDDRERLRILPLRVGDGDTNGIHFNTICPDIRNRDPSDTATLVLNRLRLIQPSSATQPLQTTNGFVYLAECTPDMEEPRSRIKALIEGLNWSVLPHTDYPEENYQTLLELDLQRSSTFVQLLGPYPWKRGDYDRIQYAAALGKKLRVARYRSCDIDLQKVHWDHRKFLEGMDIIRTGFEDFKAYLERELKILGEQLNKDTQFPEDGKNPLLVRVVIRSPSPDPLWDAVFRWIYDEEKMLAHQLGPDESLEEKHQAEPCHGILVVCDGAALHDGPHSPRKDMEQCRQIQLKEKNPKKRPPVGLVYWPPPEASWARLLRSTPQKLYRVLGSAPDNLHEFFAEVRKVGA